MLVSCTSVGYGINEGFWPGEGSKVGLVPGMGQGRASAAGRGPSSWPGTSG